MGYICVVMQSYVKLGIFKSSKKFQNLEKPSKIGHFLREFEKGESCVDFAEDARYVRRQR